MRAVKDGLGVPRHLGAAIPPAPHQTRAAPLLLSVGDPGPSRVDTRLVEPYLVKDQGSIGACTAFAVSACMRYALLRQAAIDWQPSELWIYQKSREAEGAPLSEDSGAALADVVDLVAHVGAPSEGDWPYDASKWTEAAPSDVDARAAHPGKLYFHCPDERTVRSSLAQGFPVAMGFSVPDNWMSQDCARTGIVRYPSSGEAFQGKHAVALVAVDDSMTIGADVGAYLFLNSWSEDWGLGGYGWLSRRFVTDYGFDAWTIRLEEP